MLFQAGSSEELTQCLLDEPVCVRLSRRESSVRVDLQASFHKLNKQTVLFELILRQ
jgi:hypothetical protein